MKDIKYAYNDSFVVYEFFKDDDTWRTGNRQSKNSSVLPELALFNSEDLAKIDAYKKYTRHSNRLIQKYKQNIEDEYNSLNEKVEKLDIERLKDEYPEEFLKE